MASNKKINTYNALKGIGAIGILFSHMSYLENSNNQFWKCFWAFFMSKCAVFTSFFFICSGFFLDYAWKKKGYKEYIIGKLKRIYPLVFVVFVLALIIRIIVPDDLVAKGSGIWYFDIFANIFLFKSLIPDERVFYSFHGPSWYISALFLFFIVAYPFVKNMHSSDSEKWKKRTLLVCGVTYLIELIICVAVDLSQTPKLWLCYVNPWFRAFGEGMIGVLLSQYMPVIQNGIRRITGSLLEILSLTIIIIDIVFRDTFHLSFSWAWIQFIPMGFLLIAFRMEKGCISKILKKRPFQFLGNISFELYMTHAFVYEGLPIASGILSNNLKTWLVNHGGTRFLITLCLSIVFAWIVNVLNRMFNKRLRVKSNNNG